MQRGSNAANTVKWASSQLNIKNRKGHLVCGDQIDFIHFDAMRKKNVFSSQRFRAFSHSNTSTFDAKFFRPFKMCVLHQIASSSRTNSLREQNQTKVNGILPKYNDDVNSKHTRNVFNQSIVFLICSLHAVQLSTASCAHTHTKWFPFLIFNTLIYFMNACAAHKNPLCCKRKHFSLYHPSPSLSLPLIRCRSFVLFGY